MTGDVAAGGAVAAEDAGRSAELSDRDRRVLDFERRGWRTAGAKEEAIRAELGLTTARYYQVLNAVIDTPAALVHDPMLVARLQRMREARVSARASHGLRRGAVRTTR